jgi:hypothetical protein
LTGVVLDEESEERRRFFFFSSWRKFVKISGETKNSKKLKWFNSFERQGAGLIKILFYFFILFCQIFALENLTIFPTILEFFLKKHFTLTKKNKNTPPLN